MIAHKIRIYPNKRFQLIFEEQFEYARRDYNRQLEFVERGIKDNKINEANLHESLTKIINYELQHTGFYHESTFHWVDIVPWNSRRLANYAHRKLRIPSTKAIYKGKGIGKSAFKIFASSTSGHPFHVDDANPKHLILEGFGAVKMSEKLRFSSVPTSVEISKENGRYFAAFLFPENHPAYPKTGKKIGIDVGIATMAVGVTSDKEVKKWDLVIDRRNNWSKRIDLLHRNIARKDRGDANHAPSNRYLKALKKLQTAYFRHTNLKTEFLNKTAHEIVRDYDLIGIESLSVLAMLKRHQTAQWYFHKPFGYLLRKIILKGKIAGKNIITMPKHYPSSQICSHCGEKTFESRNVKVRSWICPVCKKKHDRDINAAANILKQAIKVGGNTH